ncbi:phosphocholine cytidylyltransferase family protein [Gordonibacter sp.]|uniref:phosphocholine cytidylyltransferase family protein n=1 Tax=Gordonibacter sp. TaxID=1968902 RepID=UPI002FC6876B
MNYIFLVAGKGTRMQPLTQNYPKTLFKLNSSTTVLDQMTKMIRANDPEARIVAVTGFMHEAIEEHIHGVEFVSNPFYAVTNSLASLWFARDYLDDASIIINGDVLVSENMMKEVVASVPTRPEVLLDSSIKCDGDYDVEVIDDRVVVMSKGLKSYYGEFVGITKIDKHSIGLLKSEIDIMIHNEQYDQWYEDALIQMVFERDFALYYQDVCDYDWTEIDDVNDLLHARKIFKNSISH